MISYMSAPSSAIKSEILKSKGSIIGKYTRTDTMIPEGSFFYIASVTDTLTDSNEELYNKVGEGETLNYITVNMLSSYSNSIVPGNYVDIYAAMQWENKETGVKENQVAKLFSNIKIIDVRTNDGKSVFASSTEARTPYVIYFGLPTEQDMLVKMIHAINAWGSGGNEESAENTDTKEIKLTPVPTTTGFNVKDKDEIIPEITSYEMVKEIKEMATDVTEDLDSQTGLAPDPEDNPESKGD
jgi:hypothetical protein